MIGSKLYRKKRQVVFFVVMYGLLAVIGGALAARDVTRGAEPSGAAGFMIIFGMGMAALTFAKARKPEVSVREDRIELGRTGQAESIPFKSIVTTDKPDAGRLVITYREGHATRKTAVRLKDLEAADAERLVDFLLNRKWKSR